MEVILKRLDNLLEEISEKIDRLKRKYEIAKEMKSKPFGESLIGGIHNDLLEAYGYHKGIHACIDVVKREGEDEVRS